MTDHIKATHYNQRNKGTGEEYCGPYGCNICNLFICTVCGEAEGGLPTECPGVRISPDYGRLIYAGRLDFVNGRWRPAVRVIDGKYHVEVFEVGDGTHECRIVKTSNGQAIPEDEPTFLFRARDYLAVRALEAYREACINDGCLPEHLSSLGEVISRFKRFAKEYPEKMKQPGVTRGR